METKNDREAEWEALEEPSQGESAPASEEPQEQPGAPAEPNYEQEITQLKNELEACRAQAEENLDGWQRTLADFANYKKRIERQQSSVYQNAIGQVVRRYLEVLDDLELALKDRPQEGEGAAWAEGIELIYRKLKSFLEAEGVTPIEALGQPFDPNLHEAISEEPSEDHDSGQVIDVLQTGYMLGDRVLRPAKVRVAR